MFIRNTRLFSLYHVYNQLRSDKVNYKINNDFIKQHLKDLNKMNDADIVKFSYVLSNWYKRLNGHENEVNLFYSTIINKLQNFSEAAYLKLLKNSNYLYKNHYHIISEDFLKAALKKYTEIENLDSKLEAAEDLSNLATLFKNFKIPIAEELFQLTSEKTIPSLSVMNFLRALRIFDNLYNAGQASSLETEEIKEQIDLRIEKESESLETEQKVECLIHLILTSAKSEDLIRHLEKQIFQNLDSLHISKFPKLLRYYNSRKLHDYHYLINTVYKPLFNDFIKRSQLLHPRVLTSYLTTWKTVASFQGLYCETSVIPKLKTLISSQKAGDKHNKLASHQSLLSIFSLSNFTGFPESREISETIIKLFEHEVESLNNSTLITLAYEVSLNPGLSLKFWKSFSSVFEKLLNRLEKIGFLYGIYLNLALRDPSAYALVQQKFEPNLEEIRKHWINSRKLDLTKSIKSKFHQIVENELREQKISFVSEYYLEYFIDVAIPESKIAFEVLGPGHYVYPAGTLNGKTLNKKKNIEAMGWKYVEIPFNLNKQGLKSVQNLINSSLPLGVR